MKTITSELISGRIHGSFSIKYYPQNSHKQWLKSKMEYYIINVLPLHELIKKIK